MHDQNLRKEIRNGRRHELKAQLYYLFLACKHKRLMFQRYKTLKGFKLAFKYRFNFINLTVAKMLFVCSDPEYTGTIEVYKKIAANGGNKL